MIRLRTTLVAAALAGAACGGFTEPEVDRKLITAFVPTTFVVTGIVPEVWRVDIAVNASGVDPVMGSFETALTDRVTIRVPMTDSLNAFARGFDGDSVILYIGDTWFVPSEQNPLVTVNLKYKGPHAPTPRRAR